MERRLFEQHEQTQRHKNHGRKLGQQAVTKYTSNTPIIQYSDFAIGIRIQTIWWLAKEDVAIHKYCSLITSTLATHKYDFIITKLILIVYVLKVIWIRMQVGILSILLESISIG